MSQKVLNKKKNWIPKKYQIIEWILPGPKPATRKVDIVPLDWIIVDSRAGKNIIKSYYPPHPYTDVDILIINGAEYDKSWPKPVSINVVGEASTYDEALIHWEKINEQKERAQHLTDFIQKSKIKDKEKEIAQKQKELLASQGRQKNTNKKKRGISILLDDDDNGSENLNIDEFNNQDIIKNINQNSYSKDEDSEIQANSSSGEREVQSPPRKKRKKSASVSNAVQSNHQFVKDNPNGQTNVVKELKQFKKMLTDNSKLLKKLAVKSNIKSPIDLRRKYKINLPFKTLEELGEFEKKLKNDKACVKDTEDYMMMLIDDECNLSKSIRYILKDFLHQDVATRLTVQRPRGDKFVMLLDLPSFLKCIKETLKNQFGFSSSKILTCIGDCIMKASDWDNHRSLQKKKETERLSLAEYIQNKNVNEEELHDDQ